MILKMSDVAFVLAGVGRNTHFGHQSEPKTCLARNREARYEGALCKQFVSKAAEGAKLGPSYATGTKWKSRVHTALSRHLGPSWRHLRPTWCHFGAIFGQLGAILAPSWTLLGPSWAILPPSWPHLADAFGHHRLHGRKCTNT